MRAGAKGRGGVGGRFPTLTSIFIYHIFPGKERPGQGAEFTPAVHSQVKPFLLHSPFQRPLAIISNATESQRAENEVRGNSFSSYNGNALKRRRRRRNLIQVLSADLSACDLKCLKESSVWAYGSYLFKYSPC